MRYYDSVRIIQSMWKGVVCPEMIMSYICSRLDLANEDPV